MEQADGAVSCYGGFWGVGPGSVACYHQTGGSLAVGLRTVIGSSGNATAAYHAEGGTATHTEVYVASGAGNFGYWGQTAGEQTIASKMEIGSALGGTGATPAYGLVDVFGGSISNAGSIYVGNGSTSSSGILNVIGTNSVYKFGGPILCGAAKALYGTNVITVADGGRLEALSTNDLYIKIAYTAATNVTTVVNIGKNGCLRTNRLSAEVGDVIALLNFDGGTYAATRKDAGYLGGKYGNFDKVTVFPGGAIFDNSGYDVTIARPLEAPEGFGVTSAAVTAGGSGYIGAPVVRFVGGAGYPATGYAVMKPEEGATNSWIVDHIVITSPGQYSSVAGLGVELVGGAPGTAATVGAVTTAANAATGAVVLTGSGRTALTVTGNTYGGATVVSNGFVEAISGAVPGDVVIQGASTFKGYNVSHLDVKGLMLESGASLAIGGTSLSVTGLTVAGPARLVVSATTNAANIVSSGAVDISDLAVNPVATSLSDAGAVYPILTAPSITGAPAGSSTLPEHWRLEVRHGSGADTLVMCYNHGGLMIRIADRLEAGALRRLLADLR